VIDPDECIDCTLCEPECPENAIVAADQLLSEQQEFARLNRDLAAVWPVIAAKGAVPLDAAQWRGTAGKRQFLHLETN
jgi:ferredoxin